MTTRSTRPTAVLFSIVLAGIAGAVFAWHPGNPARGSANASIDSSFGDRSAAPQQVPGPSAWLPLNTDAPFGCGPAEAPRDVGVTQWASEGGYLHLRMCTAASPGWQGGAGTPSDARYKWWIRADSVTALLLVEDFPGSAGAGSPPADGRGEITLIDDQNSNGRFSDDWTGSSPPAYINNAIHSPLWRRAVSGSSGARQAAAGQDIGFRTGNAACGPTLDVYVSQSLLGSPDTVSVHWATDNEDPDLDVQPGCDTGPGPQTLSLVATPTEPVVLPSSTTQVIQPSPTSTSRPSPTASDTPTDEPTNTTEPTYTTEPSATPTLGPPDETPVHSPTPTSTRTATTTPPEPSDTPTLEPTRPTATPTKLDPVTSATPTIRPTFTPTPTATWTPGPVESPTATATLNATAVPSPTASGNGQLIACALADLGGQLVPFPDPATAQIVLLNPNGTPAQPPQSQGLNPQTGCAAFLGLEAGLYRVSMSVPPGWQPMAGGGMSQTLWVNGGPPPSQAIFRFMPAPCLPPCAGGGVPTPPGPPTPPGGGASGPPAVPSPTSYPVSPQRPNVGALSFLPILGYLGNASVCTTWVEAQNIGDRPAKAIFIAWGEPGFCPPQCAGPLKVECSGLLAPGSAWNFLGGQVPRGAKSGLVISANVTNLGTDIFADALCEKLYFSAVGDCNSYRRFLTAYRNRGTWEGLDFGAEPLQPLAVEVLRECPGDLRPNVRVTSSYAGVAGEYLGRWDPVFGGHAFYAPSLYVQLGGYSSFLYVQNAGDECTSVEIWFKAQNDCLRARICDILTLAPGETHQFDVGSCMPPGWHGSAWIRSTQPLAVAVDHVGNDVLMTYTGMPSELRFTWEGREYFTTGSEVAFGPLLYSEYQGWDSAVIVQNLSGTTAAKVKVYFLDRSGGVITTLVDWVCARGSQTFFLPVIAALPGSWVGSIRIESQGWFTPGGPFVGAPYIHGVAELVQYTDVMRTDVQEAIAYTMLSEDLSFDWQVGAGPGGVSSGVGRLGIPSFHKDRNRTGVTSEIAIVNVVPKPGFTNFALYIHDQNGLIDYVCETLGSGQVEYINLDMWGFINPGFKGSAVISATFWEHEVFDQAGGFTRNLVGLAAVKVERTGTVLGQPIPGDESSGDIAFPIPGPFAFSGPVAARCDGGGGGPRPPIR